MRRLIAVVSFFLVVFYFSPFIRGAEAANLEFDETAVTVGVNETFHLQVIVDAGSEQITSADAYVTYDPTSIEAQTVSEGTFFPTVTNNIEPGQVYVAGLVDDPNSPKTGSGTIATITFKTIKAGSVTLSFNCDPNVYNTSRIIKNDYESTNIIDCSQNGTATITIGESSTAQSGTPTPTPSSLPQTGIVENILKFSLPGIALLLIGGGVRLMFLP